MSTHELIAARLPRRLAALIMLETGLIVTAVAASTSLRLGTVAGWDAVATSAGLTRIAIIALVCQLCLYYADLYDLRVTSNRGELVVRLLQALAATSVILAIIYFWYPPLVIGRGVFLLSVFFVLSTVMGWRVAFEWISRRVTPRERLLLVGTGNAAVGLAQELLNRRSELGVEIVGFIDPDPEPGTTPVMAPGVVGTVDDILTMVRVHRVDRVVVCLADARGKLPMFKLLELKLGGVRFDHLASVYEEYTGKIAVENLRPSWFVFSEGFDAGRPLMATKRVIDAVGAAVGLLLAAPVMGLVALAVRLTSAGPALYHQKRVGQNGRVFTLRKFRSMRVDAEAATGAVWASKQDRRVTPIGRWLRQSRLDELPQLWNVLRGEMSFVGPRPERPEFVTSLTEQIPFYGERHGVKPGLTGWAQVRYEYGASVEDAMEKLQYDLYYCKHLSLALDLIIVFETIKTVISRRGQ